jgi:hypothetical protein
MKKHFIVMLLFINGCITTLLAQDQVTHLPSVVVTASTVVSKEINAAFLKAFPKAAEHRWYQLNKDYLVKFIQDDMKHNALFTKKGKLVYDISYGFEKNLPNDIKRKIKEGYAEFAITNTANVKEAGRNIWVVNLESKNHLVIVRLEEEEMEEVGNYDL